ncbi:MAG: hypothetical protein DRH23_13060 [Deltaproteobacteria bacterium]|nr:hypothetical protein [Deltaproteobacteria bacterium]MBW2224078.1 hypothetical protein [Deltaproteobacteria bacterium]MBW2404095.1 hypothetical protein [Deltaproteobacteria bacterium]MBW2547791.1 hypothetical protein [Deltaproteobacteria bacterium]MBW2719436.1 hypothetical protein [Deltaproteobacteria bacterium]
MTLFRVFPVLALVASVSGCSENVVPPPGGGSGGLPGSGGTGANGGTGAADGSGGSGGTGGIGGAGGTAGAGGMGGGGMGGAGGMAGVGGGGACLSQSDLDAITDLYPTSARQVAAQCGIDCAGVVGDQAFLDCTNPCIDDDIPGLSTDCESCYGDFALCIRFTCLNECALEPCGTSCESCFGYDPCFEALSQCAGRDSRDCVP